MYDEIISLENLFAAWQEFKAGKEGKADVQAFGLKIEDNLFALHEDLATGAYRHGGYEAFIVNDPKPRNIHKASVCDRVLHHAVVRVIEPLFERKFIYDSYACRKGKGTHEAVERFRSFAWKVSRNNTRTVWVLKCDIRRFFDSVNHRVLLDLLARELGDPKALALLGAVIGSFATSPGRGIPLGNLTSQLFANVYLDRLDQFAKRRLGLKYYVRYADDFVIVSENQAYLENLIPKLERFLRKYLLLDLHRGKLRLLKWHQGVDFLGYVSFPHHAVLRTKTKRRLLARADEHNRSSYVGLLKHCRGFGIARHIDKSGEKRYSHRRFKDQRYEKHLQSRFGSMHRL